MASSAFSAQGQVALAGRKSFISGIGFDRATAILAFLLMGGTYLDGWAHGHGKVDKTFFTPWHAVLYSAYLLLAVVIAGTIFINHRRGYRWFSAIPKGYELAAIGVPLFMVGGAGDLIWHSLFGFEIGLEQLLSPTHLLLATSGIMIMTGPLRSFWLRADERTAGWRVLFPMFLSLMAGLMIFVFFTEYAHPFSRIGAVVQPTTSYSSASSLVVSGILLQSAILMGYILMGMKRWQLPVGSLTLIFALYVTLLSVLDNQYELIPGMIAVGIVAEVLYWTLKPSVNRPDALRVFAFIVPLLMYLVYFLTLLLSGYTIYWSIHLWLGASFLAGIVGLLVSLLVVPFQRSKAEA